MPVQSGDGPRILVVGDALLDRDRRGWAERIAPEAPVPVLRCEADEVRLGGAAAVAAMCAALGAQTTLAAVVGPDSEGGRLRQMLRAAGVAVDLLAVDATRPTTVKERIVGLVGGGRGQLLARLDRESTAPLHPEMCAVLGERIAAGSRYGDWQLILVADYGKGVCTAELVGCLQRTGLPVLVDPPRHGSWEKYHGAAALIPNRAEAAIADAQAAVQAAPELRREFALEAAIVKLDAEGLVLATADDVVRFPSEARMVRDVTGAGDQFLAALGCCRGEGHDWEAAVELANRAAGWQCGREGCVPLTREALERECGGGTTKGTMSVTGVGGGR